MKRAIWFLLLVAVVAVVAFAPGSSDRAPTEEPERIEAAARRADTQLARPPGELVAVAIIEATPHSLIGEVVAEQSVKRGAANADEHWRSAVSGA